MAAIEYEVSGRIVRVTSPERVYFPEAGVTKKDIADYIVSVGDGIVAALYRRPTTLERWPQGTGGSASLMSPDNPDGSAFYQKRAPKTLPDWIETAEVRFPSGRTAVQVTPTDLASVLYLVNLSTLRFHPWPVTAPDTDSVDQLRIDLDPQPGCGIVEARTAAIELRAVLADAGLTGYAKTSGGRGLHVFCPVTPCDFIDARHAAIAVGRELERRLPSMVTTAWWKEERCERIFVDFNQMARDRLMTSAYSIRPLPAATVSAPLSWDEVADVDPSAFTVATMPARYAEVGDVWAPMYAQEPTSIATAVGWFERDAERGLGEMPYPPEYPKMPGEPPRVQPSRKNPDNWV